MAKKNRDKIMEQSFYDFLCMMNANIRTYPSTLCIMSALGYKEYDRLVRCKRFDVDCAKCLASWMNEQPF
jgi:hypothetical protein